MVAICVVLAGSFFFFQKREEAVEARIDSFVAENLNKPYHIKGLEQFPFIRKATLTLTKYKKEQADSLFHLNVLDLDQNEKQVDIPLISSISRGKSEHEGDSFEFAHIVTHPVLNLIDRFFIFKIVGCKDDSCRTVRTIVVVQ